MQKKYNVYTARLLLLFLLFFFSLPLVVHAGDSASDVVLIPEDEDDMEDAIEELEKECGSGGYIIFKDDVNDKFYGGSGKAVFYWLKDKYDDETWVSETDPDDEKDWGEVDSKFDNFDSSVFANKVSSSGSTNMWIMQHTIIPVLTMTDSEYTFVKGYMELMIPIGFTLCLMHAMLYLVNCNIRDLKSPETIIYAFTKFLFGVALVQMSPLLAKGAFMLSNSFMNTFTTDIGTTLETAFSSSDLIDIAMGCDKEGLKDSFLNMLNGLVGGVIGTVLTSIITIVASVLCYSRKIEFGLRSVFLPIAVADASGAGTSGPGVRFLKKLFGVALQAGAIVFLFVLVLNLSHSSTLSGIILPIALLGSIGTAKKIAEEAMGA